MPIQRSRTPRSLGAALLMSLVGLEVGAQTLGPKISQCNFTADQVYQFARTRGWSSKCYAPPGISSALLQGTTNGVGCRYSGSVLLNNALIAQARVFYKPGAVAPNPAHGWKLKTITASQIPAATPVGSDPDHALIARSIQLVPGDTSQVWMVSGIVLERAMGICSKALQESF